jgi:hypothetical protein
MTHDRDFFTPDNVDDQVEHISHATQEDDFSYAEQAEMPAQVSKRLIKDLQAYYQVEQQEDIASLKVPGSAFRSTCRRSMQTLDRQANPCLQIC